VSSRFVIATVDEKRETLFAFFHSMPSRIIASCPCSISRIYPDRYFRLRYEDLVRAPSAVMDDLFAKLLPGVAWNADQVGESANRHQLYGNRMRGRPLSLADIKEDAAWRSDMPAATRALAASLTWPLRHRYGYR
jgi:hypothetical protein